MEKLQNILFIALTCMYTNLKAMEKDFDEISDLSEKVKYLIYVQEKQEKTSIAKIAHTILQLLRESNNHKITSKLEKISTKNKLKVAQIYLNTLAQEPLNDNDYRYKMNFIEIFFDWVDTKFLPELRCSLVNSLGIFRKTIESLPKTKEAQSYSSNMLKWFITLLEQTTEKLSEAIESRISQEKIPSINEQLKEQAEKIIKRQNAFKWKTFNSKLLANKKLDSTLFLNYLFLVYLPSKNFNNKNKKFSENCKAMSCYINTILLATKSSSNITKLLHELLAAYPTTTDFLFSFNDMVSVSCSISRHQTITSTLLCPRLFLMNRLATIYINHQSKIIIQLLLAKNVEKCGDKLGFFLREHNNRLVLNLLKKCVKRLCLLSVEDDIKYELLNDFAISLKNAKAEKTFHLDLIDNLDESIKALIYQYFKKIDQISKSLPLIELFKQATEKLKE